MSKCLCDKETSRTKRNTPNPYLHFTRTLTAPATIWPEGVSDGPNESSLTIDDCKTPVGSGMGNDAWPVAIHFENPEIMFASNAPYKGFKRSVNNGVIWEYYKKFSDEIVTTVVYNPSDHKNWIISGTGTWESFDTGESWSEPLDFPVVSLFQYDSEGHLWGLNNEGIHLRQKESSDWKKVNFVNNIIPKNIVVLYQDGHRYLVVGTEGSGLHLKKDAGDWSEISNTLPFDISVSSINFSNSGNTAVISVQMNSLYSLNKKKKEWTKLAHPIGRISDFDLLEDMSRIYYSGYSIYFWKTGTPSWKELDHGLGSEAWFTNVRISPIDPTIVYAVGMDKDGKYFFLKFIQKNGDHGKPVLKTPLVGTEIGNISFHSDNKKTIYLTSRSYLLKSLDEGKTWQKYPINPGNQGCNHVAGLILDPANTQEMYTTNNCSQLFYSSTEGEQWKELTPLRFPETSPTEEFGVNNFDIGLSKNKKVFAVYDINHISSNTGPVKYSLDDKKTWKDIDNSELPDGYDFMVIKSAKWNPEIIIAGDYSKGVFWRKIKEQ